MSVGEVQQQYLKLNLDVVVPGAVLQELVSAFLLAAAVGLGV